MPINSKQSILLTVASCEMFWCKPFINFVSNKQRHQVKARQIQHGFPGHNKTHYKCNAKLHNISHTRVTDDRVDISEPQPTSVLPNGRLQSHV